MRKQTRFVSNRVNKKQLYNSIMESVIPEIKKALKEAEPDLYSKYVKTSTSRRFSVR